MASANSTFRSWLISAILIVVAAALTVPWSYWVIKAAYDRDVVLNAVALAHRVEMRMAKETVAEQARAQYEFFEAIKTELDSDRTVLDVVFVNGVPGRQAISWWSHNNAPQPRIVWSATEQQQILTAGVNVGELNDKTVITVPWARGNRGIGFTYLEFSSTALRDQFWKKEGSLVVRVIFLTFAVLSIFSAVGIYAYRTWCKVDRVQRRAELAQQGLLAERGLTAAVLAHEIRNPLAALRFQLHSLRKNSATPERVATTADTIDAELFRIQQLVTDYLEHEKARTLRVQPVDLEDAARKLQVLMAELFRQTNTELVVDAPAAPVKVMCDPHALRQVLMNLVLNAQQAMGRNGRVTLAIGQDDGCGTVDVTDNGPGIPEEMRERLFRPFQTNKPHGHGIGLALVRRFVDNFGGKVSVDSQTGHGTTFHLRLPLEGHVEEALAPKTTAPEEAEAHREPDPVGKRRNEQASAKPQTV